MTAESIHGPQAEFMVKDVPLVEFMVKDVPLAEFITLGRGCISDGVYVPCIYLHAR